MTKKLNVLGLMLGALSMSSECSSRLWDEPTKEDIETRKRRLAKAEIERNKSNGLKEFHYENGSVWAINQKVADKKAKKLNYI